MGLREVKRALKKEKNRREKGKEKMIRELEQVIDKFSDASASLHQFEEKWGEVEHLDDLQARFRQALGAKRKLNDTFWGRLSGKFYLALAIQILTLLKGKNMPIVSLSEVIKTLHEERPATDYSPKDVRQAINILEEKGLIIGTFTKEGVLYIEHGKVENDIEKVFKVVEKGEKFNIAELLEKLEWTHTRIERTIGKMIDLGLVVKKEYPPQFWLTDA